MLDAQARARLVQFGQSGRPWPFLAEGLPAFDRSGGDPGLRYLIARNLLDVGLSTLAGEFAAGIPEAAEGTPPVVALRDDLASAVDDRVAVRERIETGRANLEALLTREPDLSVDLRAAFEAWAAREPGFDVFRATDGNVVRRPAGVADRSRWIGPADQIGDARLFAADERAGFGPDATAPRTIEGVCPPWLLLEAHRMTPRQATGFHAGIRLIQTDLNEFFDGLSMAEMTEALSCGRLSLFLGPEAGARFAEHVCGRLDLVFAGAAVSLPTLRVRAEPGPGELMREARRAQWTELVETRERVNAFYAGKDAAWWARRYAEALAPGSREPLRVLLPACRHSTYVQHASEDLARAFRDAGHEAEVLIEPDDTASFSALGSWRAVDRLRPDLAVLINYPRHERSEMLPENVPVVCWVQDMMPHLVRAGAWEALGELDFVVGHAPARFFREGGLRPDRVLPAPVVVSEAKFHGELVDEATRAVFECEVAYVSHQSETPEDMCERIAAEIEPREVAPVLTELFPRVREAVASFANERTTERLRSLTEAGLRACFGDGLEANVVTQLVEQYTTPLAERMLRHQTLDWAVEICERRGWRLKIFGKGWERVERFAAFACGELAHGDALRASYRCAAVHLHPTVRSFVHQRPMECALSGGLALLRSSPGMLPRDRLAVTAFEMDRGGPEAFKADPPGYDVTEDWRAMMLTAQKQRLGYEARGRLWAKTPSHPEGIRRRTGPVRGDLFAHEIYGDLAEISFTDAAGLERLIERAVTRPAWREAVSAMVAKRVRRSATTRGLVELLTGFVSSRLGEAGERSSAA